VNSLNLAFQTRDIDYVESWNPVVKEEQCSLIESLVSVVGWNSTTLNADSEPNHPAAFALGLQNPELSSKPKGEIFCLGINNLGFRPG
jgi:hypothetical protein